MSALHVVVSQGSSINHISDLRGARVGFYVLANATGGSDANSQNKVLDLVAHAYGLSRGDLRVMRGALDEISHALTAGQLSAGFILGGYPISAVDNLIATRQMRLLPIGRDAAAQIRAQAPFYRSSPI